LQERRYTIHVNGPWCITFEFDATGAGVWLRMQAAYDTWHAERELAAEVKKIPTLTAA
jgi:hypothetical protein